MPQPKKEFHTRRISPTLTIANFPDNIIDPVAVEAAMYGRPVRLSKPELLTAVQTMKHRRGMNAAEIAERLRLAERSIVRFLREAEATGVAA